MRTERAPTTALSGKNISEDALAISTAILAVPYAAFQTDSFDDPGSLGAVSVGSQEEEAMARAMALDTAASALRSLTRGRNVASSCLMYSEIGRVGVGGGLFVGVIDDEDFFRRWRMVDERTNNVCRPSSLFPWPLDSHRAWNPWVTMAN